MCVLGMEYQLAKPITIGNDCWLGGGVTVYPGVTIGDGVVIAGASAVTKNVSSNIKDVIIDRLPTKQLLGI